MRNITLFFLATLATSSVQSEIIFNNLGPGDTFSASGRILIGPTAGVFSDINQAAPFSVGPTAHFLTDVVLGLGVNEYPSKPFSPSTINVLVTEDSAGVPGTVLRALPYNITAMGDQAITVSDAGSLLLQANTDYWVIADAEGNFEGAWRFNMYGDLGLTASQTENNPWNLHPDDDMFALRVEGISAVPEPAALLLVVLGLALLPGWCFLRRPVGFSSRQPPSAIGYILSRMILSRYRIGGPRESVPRVGS